MGQRERDAARAQRIAELRATADRHQRRYRELELEIMRRFMGLDSAKLQALRAEQAREKDAYEKSARALGRFGPRKQKAESPQAELFK